MRRKTEKVGKKYEIIEHTADIGIRAFGGDLRELFVNSAQGMFAIIADLDKVEVKKSLKIECKAESAEELLVSWLGELLYHFNVDEILGKEFTIIKLDNNYLEGEIGGDKFDSTKHSLKNEIKGVTYHNLKIEKKDDLWQVEVIFDV